MDKLRAAPDGGRIVNVVANAYRLGEVVLDDLQFEQREYKPGEAYAQSKLSMLLFTRKLRQNLDGAFSPSCGAVVYLKCLSTLLIKISSADRHFAIV